MDALEDGDLCLGTTSFLEVLVLDRARHDLLENEPTTQT